MSRIILSQGDRDGACFLYAIANSVGLLRGAVTQAEWKSFIKNLPIRTDNFLLGEGTGNLADNHHIYEEIIKRMLHSCKIEETVKIESCSNINSENALQKIVTKSSVAITCINNGKHWVAISDVFDATTFIACSSEALRAPTKYTENLSPKFNRAFNSTKNFENLKIHNHYCIKLSKI